MIQGNCKVFFFQTGPIRLKILDSTININYRFTLRETFRDSLLQPYHQNSIILTKFGHFINSLLKVRGWKFHCMSHPGVLSESRDINVKSARAWFTNGVTLTSSARVREFQSLLRFLRYVNFLYVYFSYVTLLFVIFCVC